MSLKLPEPIAAYFAGTNAHNIDAMLASFAETAIVQDEGQEMHGHVAIRRWMQETIRKYRFTVAVTNVAEENGKPVVTARVSGTFAGSPVDLHYFFTLAGDKITRLEILP